MSEKLIECVRKYPCLYDTRNTAYKNVSAKARLWETIGTEINESGETARKKWKSLRDNYMRYKKEIAGTTGQAAKKFQKWPWAAHLQFLDVTLTERERTSNITLTRAKISPETRPETSPENASTAMPLTSFTNEPTSEQGVNPTTSSHSSQESLSVHSRAKKQKKDFSDMDKVVDDVVMDKVMEYMHNKKEPDYDAADNLFKSYAQTFKKLSLKNQVFVKLELAKLFAEIELKDAEEKAQITDSPIHSVLSSNSESQDSKHHHFGD